MRQILLTSAIITALTSAATEAQTDTLKNQTLDEVIVTATGANRNLKAAEMGRHVIGKEAIMKLPVLFGEPDIVKTLQTLPGVSQGVEALHRTICAWRRQRPKPISLQWASALSCEPYRRYILIFQRLHDKPYRLFQISLSGALRRKNIQYHRHQHVTAPL